MDARRAMLQIKALARDAHLEMSEFTGQWFVSARIEIGDGTMLMGVTEHRDWPEAAVLAYLERLQQVESPQFLVVGAMGVDRREYRWNGAHFAEIPWR